MQFAVITWNQLEKDCIALARNITASKKKIDEIVSISRGGMVVARILSDLLDVPVSHIGIQSYQHLESKEPVVTQMSPRDFQGEHILLVDELSDTGKTFEKALTYLSTLPVGEVLTASAYIKPHTTFVPDFWIKNIAAWLIFPYELRETKETFMKEFGEEEGKHKLLELGILDWEDTLL